MSIKLNISDDIQIILSERFPNKEFSQDEIDNVADTVRNIIIENYYWDIIDDCIEGM